MKRGIVITPRFGFDGRTLSLNGFDPVSIRQYLLYWDKIDWPDNNIISFGDGGAEFGLLISEGVMERTRVHFPSFDGNAGYALLGMQLAALEARDTQEPGAWSLAQHSPLLAGAPHQTIETRAIEVELYSAIPVPAADVPFAEVLEFKYRRGAELLHFREAMDQLFQETIAAADLPRAKLQAQAKLQRAMQDLHDVFGESFRRRLLSSLKVELNLPSIGALAAGGAFAATSFGIPIAVGAAAGAIAAAVKFDLPLIRKGVNIPDHLRAYAYLHHIEQELK